MSWRGFSRYSLGMTWSEANRDKVWVKTERLNLCNCGSGSNYHMILEMLTRIASLRLKATGDMSDSMYQPAEDASARWVEFVAHVLDSWGLIEHGTGIGWPCLTDDGLLVKAFLEDFGTDDDKWPEWYGAEDLIASAELR